MRTALNSPNIPGNALESIARNRFARKVVRCLKPVGSYLGAAEPLHLAVGCEVVL